MPVDDPAVGTVIMWGADVAPAGWLSCDGQTLSPATYPQTVGNPAFPVVDGQVRTPDLRGFFVRGAEDRTPEQGAVDLGAGGRIRMFGSRQLAAYAPLSIQDDTIGAHDHEYEGFPEETDSTIVSRPGFWSMPVFTFSVDRTDSLQQEGGAGETRPINIYLRYIVYVGGAAPQTDDEVPAGAVVLWGAPAAPASWLICDGRTEPAPPGSVEAGLAPLLGGFGEQREGVITTPDLRGQFIRGVDGGTNRDLAAGDRQRSNGIDVGSRQVDAYQAHAHSFTKFPGQENYWQPWAQDLWDDQYYSHGQKNKTGSTGLAETRPINVAFNFVMKASRLTGEVSVMPVGAIVMWPGSTGWPNGWLACDGMDYPINSVFRNLYNVIGDTFRPDRIPGEPPGSTNGRFYMPDLQGLFVRGLDDSTESRDPDRLSRTNLDRVVVGPVLGSIQGFALAAHPHQVSHWPGDATVSGERFGVQGYFGGWQPLDGARTEAAGGVETRPRNTAMNFIIKYSDWRGSTEG
jgi:microcystin-dependent protein